MKKYILLIYMLLLSLMVSAQNAVEHTLIFDTTRHSLGTISEDDKPVNFSFHFTNKGTTPIVITRVEITCGCTVPTYTKAPVMAGMRGTIDITYHPKGQPGVVNRNIYVHLANSPTPITLSITGTVTPTTDKYSFYPAAIGPLRMKRKEVDFRDIIYGKQRIERIEVVNSGSKPLTLTFPHTPPHIVCTSEPKTIMPNQVGDIVITYISEKTQTKGIILNEIYIEGLSPTIAPSKRAIVIKANIRN